MKLQRLNSIAENPSRFRSAARRILFQNYFHITSRNKDLFTAECKCCRSFLKGSFKSVHNLYRHLKVSLLFLCWIFLLFGLIDSIFSIFNSIFHKKSIHTDAYDQYQEEVNQCDVSDGGDNEVPSSDKSNDFVANSSCQWNKFLFFRINCYQNKWKNHYFTFLIDSATQLTVRDEIYDISSDSDNDDIFEFYEIDSDSEHSTNESNFEDSLLEPLVGGAMHERMDTAESNASVDMHTNQRLTHIESGEWNVTKSDRVPLAESKVALAHLINRKTLPTHFSRYAIEADTTSKSKLITYFFPFWERLRGILNFSLS